jgi:hypothetical protein
MADERERVAETMRRITSAWVERRVNDLTPFVHPEIVTALPGFVGRAQGRDRFIAGFRDFTENATLHHFREGECQVDVIDNTAVVNVDYEMVYERSAERYRVTGRDVWVFQKQGDAWLAMWRTMLDLTETPA